MQGVCHPVRPPLTESVRACLCTPVTAPLSLTLPACLHTTLSACVICFQGREGAAGQALRQAQRCGLSSPELLVGLGDAFTSLGRYDSAADCLARAAAAGDDVKVRMCMRSWANHMICLGYHVRSVPCCMLQPLAVARECLTCLQLADIPVWAVTTRAVAWPGVCGV
jgi:hypothetical protein